MEVIKFLQSFSSPFLDGFFQLITMMGEDTFFIIVMALVFWCIDKKAGYRIGFAYLSNGILNTALKETFRVPRPIGKEGIRSLRLETAGGYSFPSGHSQSAASLWTSLMLEVRKKWFYLTAVVLMLLVGLSRIYLGVHTLIDVIFGLIIGVSWVLVSNWIFNYADRTNKKSIFLIILIPSIIGLFFYQTETYYKACGTFVGLIAGYIIESKYIKYKVDGKLSYQVVKITVGLVILLLLKIGIKIILPDILISDFLRYFILANWLTVLAPYLFKFITGNLE